MNQLTKLIEQYEEATGRPAFEGDINGNCDFSKNFVKWLASRPTCGEEQRKFLDVLEEDFKWLLLPNGNLRTSTLVGIDLQKVIKGE